MYRRFFFLCTGAFFLFFFSFLHGGDRGVEKFEAEALTYFEQSFGHLVDFVQREIDTQHFGVVGLVVVIILKERKKINIALFSFFFFSPPFDNYLILGDVEDGPYGQSSGTLNMPDSADANDDLGVAADDPMHRSKRQTHRFDGYFSRLQRFDKFAHRRNVRVDVLCAEIFTC